MFEIALSNHAVYAVACAKRRQRCPNHRNVRSKLFPMPRTDTGSTSSPRTSRFPNSIIKQRYKLSRRIQRQPLIIPRFGHVVKSIRKHSSNNSAHPPNLARSTRPPSEANRPAPITRKSIATRQTFWASPNHKLLYTVRSTPVARTDSTNPIPTAAELPFHHIIQQSADAEGTRRPGPLSTATWAV